MIKVEKTRMDSYRRKGDRKRKHKEYYPLSNASRYLIHLANLFWWGHKARGTIAGLYKDMKATMELAEFDKGNVKQKEYLKHFAPPSEIKFNPEALQKHWPQSLLEIKVFLSLWAGNMRSVGEDAQSKIFDLLDSLRPGLTSREYIRLWFEKRFSGMPFYLKSDLTLVPHYDKKDPVQTLWAWTAALHIEIKGREDRLKLCEFIDSKGEHCLNLFWDESKNKARKFCNEIACKKNRDREKVATWRKNFRQRLTSHGEWRRYPRNAQAQRKKS